MAVTLEQIMACALLLALYLIWSLWRERRSWPENGILYKAGDDIYIVPMSQNDVLSELNNRKNES